MSVTYTDPAKVTAVKLTEPRRFRGNAMGYGSEQPTQYMIEYDGIWRRVYAMVYGNSGSTYVHVYGDDVFLDTDTDYRLMALRDSTDPSVRNGAPVTVS